MIVVDASALLAIALNEPDAASFAHKLGAADACVIGAPTALEAHISLRRFKRPSIVDKLTALINRVPVSVVPFEQRHFDIALRAHDRYGRGNHPAALNFGDCMAYAVAKAEACPLLFKGNDFSQTDITPA